MPNTPENAWAGPRRIVPTVDFVARGVTPVVGAPVPHLQNHGGPVIGSVEVVPVYWGAAWASGPNALLVSQLDRFFDFIVTSSYMDLLHEYSTASMQIQHGRRLTSAQVSNSEPGTVTPTGRQVTDAQIRTALQGWIANHTVPATTANTLYFIFLPPNVVSVSFGTQSCRAGGFCGYHDHIGNVYYAVIPFVNCSGCVFPGQFLDTLTEVASHELAEAITDPELNAWWDPVTGPGDEIGDICNRQTTRLGDFVVQTEWSNAQAACVVAPAGGWNSDWFPLPGQAVFDREKQQIAAVSRAAGNLDLFVIGFDNHVWSTFWNAAGGWNSDWFPLPGQAVFDREKQQIAAVSRAAGNLDLFVIGFDNHVWSTFWNAAGGWNSDWFPLPGQAVFDREKQQIAAVSRAAGNLDLFVIGFDNHVWSTFWNAAGGWNSDWFPLPGQAVFDREKQQIAAVSRATGNLDLFVIGFDNHVWSTFWTG